MPLLCFFCSVFLFATLKASAQFTRLQERNGLPTFHEKNTKTQTADEQPGKARMLHVATLPGAASWKRGMGLLAIQHMQEGLLHLLFTELDSDSLVGYFYRTLFGIEDVISPSSCSVLLTVDGQQKEIIRFAKYANRYRRNYFSMEPLPKGEHTSIIQKGSAVINKK